MQALRTGPGAGRCPCSSGTPVAATRLACAGVSPAARGRRVARRHAAGPVTSAVPQQQEQQQHHHHHHQQQQQGAADGPSTSGASPTATGLAARGGRVACFRASKQAVQLVPELPARSLAEYMALPASQYSVLDARKIERVDDTTFRCYVGQLAFLGFSVEPVITVSVTVEERGCTIRLLSCQLQGSRLVEEVNDKFTAQMTNRVSWAPTADPATKQITSDTTIEVDVEVPGWFLLPTKAVEGAGSGVMAATLRAMVPRFLAQLEKDYNLWASGDESRRPIGEGVL